MAVGEEVVCAVIPNEEKIDWHEIPFNGIFSLIGEKPYMPEPILCVNNLHVSIDKTPVLNGVSLSVGAGEVHVLMGPNGSGKSTLAHAIMGSPAFTITSGTIGLCGIDITNDPTEARAKKGLYLGFQNPVELAGVGMMPFLRNILASGGASLDSEVIFRERMGSALQRIGLAPHVLDRNVNEGFSGGEKKRNEIFQLSVFRPRIAVMDEIDSGLDVDGSRMVSEELQRFVANGGTLFLITHSGIVARMLNPHTVHIMKAGRIVQRGGKDLLEFVEKNGFESL